MAEHICLIDDDYRSHPLFNCQTADFRLDVIKDIVLSETGFNAEPVVPSNYVMGSEGFTGADLALHYDCRTI